MASSPQNPWYHDPKWFSLVVGAGVGAVVVGVYLIGSDPKPEVPSGCVQASVDLVHRAHNVFMEQMSGTVSEETIRAYQNALKTATNPATQYAHGVNPVVFPEHAGDVLAVVSPVRSDEIEFLGGLPDPCADRMRNIFVFGGNDSPSHQPVMATDEAYDAAMELTK